MLINPHSPEKGETVGKYQMGEMRDLREKTLRECGVGIAKSTLGLLPQFSEGNPLRGLERVHIFTVFHPCRPELEE